MKDIRYLVQPQQPAIEKSQAEIIRVLMEGVLEKRQHETDLHADVLKEMRTMRNAMNQYRDMVLTAIKNIPQHDAAPTIAAIRAIPRTDLTPTLEAVKGIKFPEIPKPEKVDFTQVLQQIDRLTIKLDTLEKKVDSIDVRPIVATSTPRQRVVEQKKPDYEFTIERNQAGGIKKVTAKAI